MENVRQAMVFLNRNLSLRYEIKGLFRDEILEIPEDALREAVLNAVMHRDYNFDTAWITIEIYRNRVEISDPGGLPSGMSLKDLGKKSVHRNPLIADLFHRLGEVERVGSGIGRIKKALEKAKLPTPKFENTSFYTIIFKRTKKAAKETAPGLGEKLGIKLGIKLGKNEETILSLIQKNPHILISDLSKILHISTTAVENNIAKLRDRNLLKRIGSKKSGYWEIIHKR